MSFTKERWGAVKKPKSSCEKTKSRSENIKTELWESRKHEGIVMKSIRNKRKVLERGNGNTEMEDSGVFMCE